jgi:subtilisin family serine protease
VDVCAPGVGIVSSVPPSNFAAWDGTSMAAPHISGLAALMLAHHPAFQGQTRMRSAERVERLFQLIRMSARRVSLADPTRVGYGMPDALVALGLALGPGQQAFQSMWGALLGAAPVAAAAMPEAIQRPLAAMAPFGFAPGALGPQGW